MSTCTLLAPKSEVHDPRIPFFGQKTGSLGLFCPYKTLTAHPAPGIARCPVVGSKWDGQSRFLSGMFMFVISIYITAVTLRFLFAEVAVLGMFSVETWVHCEAGTTLYNNPSIVLESRGQWAKFMLLFGVQNSKLQLPLGSTPARFPPRFPKTRG